jgi:membrane protease YdiL (CAAX protease family)
MRCPLPSILSTWRRVPVLIRAIALGWLLAAAGTYPWKWLANANMRYLPSVPWGPVAMAAYLWLYWRYATGHGWPAASRLARRESARAHPVDGSAWGPAIVAGILGLWFSVAVLRLIGRFIVIPQPSAVDISRVSPVTLLTFVLMGALVAGVVEEVSFRGYMQRPIERRYGPTVAIAVVGVMFGLAHGTHSYWSLWLMPYYIAVAAVYGGLAYLTDSIVPSLTLHAGADALDALMSLAGGGSVVQQAGAPRSGLGAEVGLTINILVLVGTGVASMWAYRELAELVRSTKGRANGAVA